MRLKLIILGVLCGGILAASAYAASGASFSGDRALLTKFRLDDGLTGAAGYRRAYWTSTAPVRATLVVRNAKGRIVETVVGGNQYSATAGLTWISSDGRLVTNRSLAPAGLYRMTLTITAYEKGSISLLSADTVVAKWSGKVPDHKTLCVPHVTATAYMGCG